MAGLGDLGAIVTRLRPGGSDATPGLRTLPNGLQLSGATRIDVRFQQHVADYFRAGTEFRPGMTVVDLGANIGMFALEVLRRTGGGARVIAIEPAAATFAHLEDNLHRSFPDADVRLYQSAIGDHSGEVVLYFRPGTTVMSSIYHDASGGTEGSQADLDALVAGILREPPPEHAGPAATLVRRLPRGPVTKLLKAAMSRTDPTVVEQTCQIRTLSEILAECQVETVDFLKIDVEGAEADVLAGIDDADWPKLQAIVAEVHDVDGRVGAITEQLHARGFAHVRASQDWPFEGTRIYNVTADRRPG